MRTGVASKSALLPWRIDLPTGWDVVQARRVFRERKRTGFDDHPLLSVTQDKGVITREESDLRVWNPGADISGYKLVLPGDFVISLRSFQGGFERSGIEGLVSPAYTPFYSRTLEPSQLEFLRHYFKSEQFVSSLQPLTSGIRQGKNISFADFGEAPLPIPPTEEAKAIASYLDRETARIDTLIEKKGRLLHFLEEKRTTLMTRAVTRGLGLDVPMKDSGVEWIGEIPEHWEVTHAKAMFELHRGFDLPEPEREEGAIPVVSSGGVVGNHNQARMQGPGVVTGRYGSVGSVYYIDGPYWPLNTALYVRRFRGNHPRYVFYLLGLLPVLHYAAKSAVPGVDRKDVHEERIPYPPLREQIEISDYLRTIEIDAAEARDRLIMAISLLQEYRTALISVAVNGKVEVRENVHMIAG